MSSTELILSSLAHSWIIDLDGTILKHNGYKIDGVDTLLPNAKKFMDQIPIGDLIIFLTSRTNEYKHETLKFLENNNIRYDYIIFNAPYGERILINDNKPSGLKCSLAVNFERNRINITKIKIDNEL